MAEIKLVKNLCPLPQVKRGYGYHINHDSKRGKRFIYTNGKTVLMRDLEDPTTATVFAGEHKANVTSAAWSPTGEYVASGDEHGCVLVWGQGNHIVKSTVPTCACVLDLAWDPESKRIAAVGDGQGFAKVFMMDSGSSVGNIMGHTKRIISVAYKPSRPYRIVTTSEDMQTILHAGPPFKLEKRLEGRHDRFPNKVQYTTDGTVFLTVGSDSNIVAADGTTGELIKKFESKDGHAGAIYNFAFSPDCKQFVTAGADKTAKLWDYESGAVLKTFTFGNTVDDMQLSVFWIGEQCCTVSLSGAINYLDFENPSKPKKIIMGHKSQISSLAVDGSTFFTADSAGVLCKWSADYEATWFTGAGHPFIVAAALNADKTQIVTVGLDDQIRFNNVASGEFASGQGLSSAPKALACGHKDASLTIVGLSKDAVTIFRGGKSATVQLGFTPREVEISPDDSKFSVCHKKGVNVYSLNGVDAKLETEYADHSKPANCGSWSPDGKHFLTTGEDARVLVYLAGQTKVLNPTEWAFHSGQVSHLAFSPNSKRVATVAMDLSIRVWSDLETYKPTNVEFKLAHREGIQRIGWLDDSRLVSIGVDGVNKVWEC